MKRILSIILILFFASLVGGTFYFLWAKTRKKSSEAKTETPQVTDIVKKTVATGAIVPRQEVEIKPKVSGVLEELYVEPGRMVKKGDPIGKIQIVPDAVNLNRAEADVRSAKIAYDNAKRELDRNQKLFAQGIISDAELQKWKTENDLRKQEYNSASSNLQLVKEGAARGSKGTSSNIVVSSTVDGMIIDVPVKKGFSVIESNNFNPGTTVAVVADMGDMIFQGQVDESEVGKIQLGMKLEIKIGAIEDQTFEGTLEYIAPKGKEIDGAIQFEIKAAIVRKADVFIRAGYSANADIVLEAHRGVMAIREALLQFDEGKPYVEVETSPKQFERRDIELGLSDGINVEVKSGLAADASVKIPANAGPASMEGGRGGRGAPRGGAFGAPRRR
jgi:HlyD family secretion protein